MNAGLCVRWLAAVMCVLGCGEGSPCPAGTSCPEPLICLGGVCSQPDRSRGSSSGGAVITPIGGGGRPGDSCATSGGCRQGTTCYNSYCVGDGPLRVSLGFSVDTDLDLHVLTPGMVELFYAHRTGGGGELDVDQCVTMCGTQSHVENVVFASTPASGTYSVWVVNFDGRSTVGSFTVDVSGRVTQRFSEPVPQAAGQSSSLFAFRY